MFLLPKVAISASASKLKMEGPLVVKCEVGRFALKVERKCRKTSKINTVWLFVEFVANDHQKR